jgi:hypothetical protein
MMAMRFVAYCSTWAAVLVALDGVPSLASPLGVEARHDALHAAWMASPSVVADETGKVGPMAFAAGVVADLKLPVTPQWFWADFVGWFKGPLPGASALLNEIPNEYCVAALSNMSASPHRQFATRTGSPGDTGVAKSGGLRVYRTSRREVRVAGGAKRSRRMSPRWPGVRADKANGPGA